MSIRTPRGWLHPLAPVHAIDLHRLWTSPGVRRFLWDDRVVSLDEVRTAIAQSEVLFRKHRFGLWGFWPVDRAALSGFCGLWPFREPPVIEIVFGVDEDLWNLGYATELARSIVEYCRTTLGMAIIRASTDTANIASIRVLEKNGFRQTRRETVAGLDTLFFEHALRPAS